VDIDLQAVEVTKLSLLLKVLEGETDQSFSLSQLAFGDRALPNLADNIKRGNSLIGSDYFSGQLFTDPDEPDRILAFNWKKGFPGAMEAGGFDCVIGNPPYIDSELMTKYYAEERAYCTSHYKAASGNWDVFCVFIERALELCKKGGLHSFIVPNKLTSAEYATGIRSVIATARLISLRDYSKARVFPVAVYPVVYIVNNSLSPSDAIITYERMGLDNRKGIVVEATESLSLLRTVGTANAPWAVSVDSAALALVAKMTAKFPRLETVAKVCGAATVAEAYELLPLIADKRKPVNADIRLINSGTIDRYENLWGG
jgi:Eco57I restriction-modification methylase